MAKQVIMLPHVLTQLNTTYHPAGKQEDEALADFVQRKLCPSGRGLLVTKESEDPVRIKVWGEDFAFICAEAQETDSLKAVNIKPVKAYQYSYMLEKGDMLRGNWQFISTGAAGRSFESFEAADDSLAEELETIENKEEKKREFKEFENYWNRLDLANHYLSESLHEQKQESLAEYTDMKLDYDHNRIVFFLKSRSSNYRYDSRIRICSNDVWNKSVDSLDRMLDHISSMGVGGVYKYDVNNNRLIVDAYSSDLLHTLAKDPDFRKGRLWIDDIGSRSVVSRQRQALKRLFERQSTNPDLRDIVPETANITIPGWQEPIDEACMPQTYFQLIEGQKEAVQGALSGTELYLIQGPPGTGKTTVISTIIHYLTKKNKKVLLSSQTNLAVDNVLQRIGGTPHIQAIRIGKEENFELDCEKYSLIRRVEDLQGMIRGQIDAHSIEISVLKERVEQDAWLLEVHTGFQNRMKPIIHTVEMWAKRHAEHNELLTAIEGKRKQIAEVSAIVQGFEQSHQDKLHLFEQVNRLQQESLSTLEENVESAFLAGELNIRMDDQADISNYQDILDELQARIGEYQDIESEISGIAYSVKDFEASIEAYEMRIARLLQMNNSMELQEAQLLTQKMQDMILEQKEILFRSNGLILRKDELFQVIRELEQSALGLKSTIEQYITRHGLVWMKLYGAPTLTKKAFLDIARKISSFESEFGKNNYYEALAGLDQYLHVQERKQLAASLKEDTHRLEEELRISNGYMRKYTEKIREYESDTVTKSYLEHYRIHLTDLTLQQELERIEAFTTNYYNAKRRVELHSKTALLRSEWKDKLSFYQPCFEDVYIQLSNLICATCLGISSASNNDFLETEFDYVIIDEAARSTGLELLIPMVRGKKMILVGDHKQISPQLDAAIIQKIEANNEIPEEEMNRIFKQSLFGVMYEQSNNALKSFLNEQFRMNADISTVVSNYFYDGMLKDGYLVKQRSHGLSSELRRGFYWVDTPSLGAFMEKKDNNSSYSNEGEANTIRDMLKWMNGRLTERKSVGIIAPYGAQRLLLKEIISGDDYPMMDIEINTVDAFQGREKNIILMSLTRNNKERKMGHTATYARINVALSRAQELLFVVGCGDFVQSNHRSAKKWNQILSHLKAEQSVISYQVF